MRFVRSCFVCERGEGDHYCQRGLRTSSKFFVFLTVRSIELGRLLHSGVDIRTAPRRFGHRNWATDNTDSSSQRSCCIAQPCGPTMAWLRFALAFSVPLCTSAVGDVWKSRADRGSTCFSTPCCGGVAVQQAMSRHRNGWTSRPGAVQRLSMGFGGGATDRYSW